jgi:hypothetical protein
VNYNPCLGLQAALTLISEKVRFWSDSQTTLEGKMSPPRCMDTRRSSELRQSLIEIDAHRKNALRACKPVSRQE